MSWSSTYYGDENPSLLRKITCNSLYLCFLLWCYGWWADFVPSELWASLGVYMAIGLAVISAAGLYAYGILNRYNLPGLILTPPLLSGLYWIVLVHSIGSLATLMAGSAHSMTTELHKTDRPGINRHRCDKQLDGKALARAMPDHLCISSSAYNTLDNHSTVRLEGKMTILGFHIQNAYVSDDPANIPLLSDWRL